MCLTLSNCRPKLCKTKNSRHNLPGLVQGQYTRNIFENLIIINRPRNSYFLVVANFCYRVQDQVANLILW